MKNLVSVKYFIWTLVVTFPVVITAIDEIGQPAVVTGRSMRPNFNPISSGRRKKRAWWDYDVVWIDCWDRRTRRHNLKPGDVVALESPVEIGGDFMIKRIVATPGEKIKTLSYHNDIVTVPPCHYWVEGDNQRSSEDSNFFGPVSEGLVLGLISHILWPPQRWKKLHRKLTTDQNSRRLKTRAP